MLQSPHQQRVHRALVPLMVAFWDTYGTARAQVGRDIRALLAPLWWERLQTFSHRWRLYSDDPNICRFTQAWDRAISRGWTHAAVQDKRLIISTFVGAQFTYFFDRPDPYSDPEFQAAIIIDWATCGILRPATSGLTPDPLTSLVDGQSLFLKMDGWDPSLSTYDTDGNCTHNPEPTRMPSGHAFAQRLSLPTGRLLVGPSITLGGLHAALLGGQRRQGTSPDYAWHRIAQSAALIQSHSFVDLPVGKTALMLHQDSTGVLWGADLTPGVHPSITIPPGGRIHLVDHGAIVAHLVQTGLLPEDAQRILTEGEANAPDLHRITLTPGDWFCAWDCDGKALQTALEKSGLSAPNGTRFALFPERPRIDPALVRDLSSL